MRFIYGSIILTYNINNVIGSFYVIICNHKLPGNETENQFIV